MRDQLKRSTSSPVVYLDYHATTPCDPRVVDAMLPYFTEEFGNPSSGYHALGRSANLAVDAARHQVGALIGAQESDIIFTSGATESNNLAIFGITKASLGDRRKIVTTPIEHKAILDPVEELSIRGYEVSMLPVDRNGVIDIDAAERIIDSNTLLVSVQAASNEIGTIQPLDQVASIARYHGAVVHTDAAQIAGKHPLDVAALELDFVSLSSHKMYGPKGVGALYIAPGLRRNIHPLLFGGGQEFGVRPGTLNVPGIVGFGEACRLCSGELREGSEPVRIASLRDQLERSLLDGIPELKINGYVDHRLPGNSSLTFPSVDADSLILAVPELALSTGSACTSGALGPSHVLVSIGLERAEAYRTIRIGIGRFTDEDSIATACRVLNEAHAGAVAES